MPLEAKGCRHVAVAIPIVALAGVVAMRAGEQRTQPQHRADVSGDRCQREVHPYAPQSVLLTLLPLSILQNGNSLSPFATPRSTPWPLSTSVIVT
jgi:hypothetical protein